jgi:hypothetical protein
LRADLAQLLHADAVAETAATIAAAQRADGAIPWEPGRHVDPWDHVECAMALDVAGRHREARAAYEWLEATQRADGSWAARYERGRAVEQHAESNFVAYVAVGVRHHVLCTGDDEARRRLWPMVGRAIDFVLALQDPGGQVWWARGRDGSADRLALVTGSSSVHHSLRNAARLADELGDPQPEWELAADRLAHALVAHPERFGDRGRWSMDWYYPVLGGVLTGSAARARLDAEWERFVVPGLGIRCVADRPWVTGAETCELALALAAIGEVDRAAEQVAAMQHLRHDDGSYWTGYVWPDEARWPIERSTWTGAAVLLAADAIAGGPTSEAFRAGTAGGGHEECCELTAEDVMAGAVPTEEASGRR